MRYDDLDFAAPLVRLEQRPDGTLLLESPVPLAEGAAHVGVWLQRWADEAPQRTFLAERDGHGGWRKLTYGEARQATGAIAQALLDRGLGADRPLMLLSGNSIDHALLALAAMQVGVPVVPVSPAYSLVSQDCAKVRYIGELVQPGAVFCQSRPPFARALAVLGAAGCKFELLLSVGTEATLLSELRQTPVTPRVDEATARVGADTVAKILFTSGSTGTPKGVINTQRMLTANQQMIAQCWPFLDRAGPGGGADARPQVLLDWLPWNHTFGGNHNFNLALRSGATLYIDGGRPLPGAPASHGTIAETVRNLREISPTLYFNVPAGFAALVPYLEVDAELRQRFFAELRLLFYAAAALPQDLWERMEKVGLQATGHKPRFVSAWGSTETAPLATSVHYPIERAGVIGLPAPGVQLKLVPSGSKRELRVRGPSVTPGYFRRPELTRAAFDEEGYYRTGDGGRLADPQDPSQGIVFDGRVSEDFKLLSGTWVHVGALRVAALSAASPLLQDAVVTGHDRAEVGLLAWPVMGACRALTPELGPGAPVAQVIAHPAVREQLRQRLRTHNQHCASAGSSGRIARVLLLAEPASLDADELTDKGYVNQRAVLERRAGLVAALYAEPPGPEVIVLDDRLDDSAQISKQ